MSAKHTCTDSRHVVVVVVIVVVQCVVGIFVVALNVVIIDKTY